ncbi:MAG: hypothetical protein Q7T36_05700 [Fluviicoccus sp.]|uniref:hypothetical protein n=1 Tax=Fluviicoccus sp. TaxID=2003552 RepID=UPI00271AC021|nr:hypothetical protein [Fluviicoccus sp.]MDO8329948.1 hypothetical protein [Fluviicoccus sp.]
MVSVCQADQAAAAAVVSPSPESVWSEDSASAVLAWVTGLEKSGDVAGAASVALRGAGRFPGDDDLAREAVRLLLQSRQFRLADAFLMAVVARKPSAENLFRLGHAREQAGEDGLALKAYLSARQQGMKGPLLETALQRMEKRAVKVENLWLLPPPGWQRNTDGLSRLAEPMTLVIQAQAAADLKALVMTHIRAAMPQGMFTDAAIAQRAVLARQQQDFLKSAPSGVALPPWLDAPVLQVRPLPGADGGWVAMASVSAGQVRTSMAVLALRHGQRVYTLSLSGTNPAEELEKTLLTLGDAVIWQAPGVKP